MPLFDFKCVRCGATFEIVVDRTRKDYPCPYCGGGRGRKLRVQGAPSEPIVKGHNAKNGYANKGVE